jgi:translation initiation factor RLI1
VREGINTFLGGYLASENLRFRTEAMNFKTALDDGLDDEEEGGDNVSLDSS